MKISASQACSKVFPVEDGWPFCEHQEPMPEEEVAPPPVPSASGRGLAAAATVSCRAAGSLMWMLPAEATPASVRLLKWMLRSVDSGLLMVLQPTGGLPRAAALLPRPGYGQGCPAMIVDDLGVFPESL